MIAVVAREARAFLGLLLLGAIVVLSLRIVLSLREATIAVVAFTLGLTVEYRRAERRAREEQC